MGKLPTALRQSLVALTDQSFVKTLELNDLDDTTISALHKLVFAAEHNQCLPALDEDSIAAQIAEYEDEGAWAPAHIRKAGCLVCARSAPQTKRGRAEYLRCSLPSTAATPVHRPVRRPPA